MPFLPQEIDTIRTALAETGVPRKSVRYRKVGSEAYEAFIVDPEWATYVGESAHAYAQQCGLDLWVVRHRCGHVARVRIRLEADPGSGTVTALRDRSACSECSEREAQPRGGSEPTSPKIGRGKEREMTGFANRKITIRRERFYAHSIVGDYAPHDADLGFYVPHAADYEVITGSDLVDHADSLGREAGFAETVASVLRNAGTVSGPWGAGNWFSDPSGPTQVGPCEEPDCGCEGEYQRTDAFLYRFAPAEIRSIASALTLRERRCERN